MILIVCVDKNNGMLFNRRRQSRDTALIEHVIELSNNNNLWIKNFSKDIFEQYELKNLKIDEELLEHAENDDYCFIEDILLSNIIDKFDKIILYNWNRKYPADLYFDIDLTEWILEGEVNFKGNSHDQITQKIYKRGLN